MSDGPFASWQGQDTINELLTQRRDGAVVLAGRYKVIRQLGHGGMGSVWLAEDRKLDGRQVAIKMLPVVLATNARALQQLKNEAKVAIRLSHSHIVTLRAFEESEEGSFLVMDYIEGQTLEQVLAQKGTLSEIEVQRLFKPIAEALDYAHGQRVIHRDIKPSNIMIRDDGVPFIMDFGIAREMKDTMTRVTGKASSGTLPYMSPEQLRGEDPTPAQDVYSLAATIYECLSGNPPFYRGQIEYQIANEAPNPLSSSSPLARGVMAGLAKTPEGRPRTAGRLVGGRLIEPQRAPRAQRAQKAEGGGGWKWAAVVALLFAGGIGAMHYLNRPEPPAPEPEIESAPAATVPELPSQGESKPTELSPATTAPVAPAKVEPVVAPTETENVTQPPSDDFDLPELGLTMKKIPKGTFYMGSSQSERDWAAGPEGMGEASRFTDERNPEKVVIEKDFWLGQTVVTLAQWRKFVEQKGYETDAEKKGEAWVLANKKWDYQPGKSWQDPNFEQGEHHPVVCISWNDATAFCDWLNEMARNSKSLPDGYEYRLPGEAEWEYACRGGKSGQPFWWGSKWKEGEGRLNGAGADRFPDGSQWSPRYDWVDNFAYTSPVDYYGLNGRNNYGLADMLGNVWEWCLDWYDPAGPHKTPNLQPAQYRVLRGGSFGNHPGSLRCANRGGNPPI